MKSSFQGNRLALRPFEPHDVPALQAYLNHPDLSGRRFIPWAFPDIAPLSQRQVEGIVQRWAEADRSLPLAVIRPDAGQLIGHAECDWHWDPHQPSVQVVIAPDYQRQGHGSEVLELLMRHLLDYTPAHNVSCWIADWNKPALTFCQRHGFRVAGRMRRAGIHQGRYFDLVINDILRTEWKAAHAGE